MRELGVMVGGLQLADPRTKQSFFSFDLVDLDAKTTARFPLGFLAHGFTVDPTRPHVAAVFEKKGPGACLVDLNDKRVLATIAPRDAGCHFYGHGQYSADGQVVYCVETELASRRGVLTIRDARDFRVLGEMPTFGSSPHDCTFVDASTLVVTNGGGGIGTSERGAVTVVDVKTEKLVERIEIPTDRLNAGHVAAVSAGQLAVSSAPRDGLPEKESPGGVSFRNGGGPLVHAQDEGGVAAKMLGESLSVCVHDATGIALVTNPWCNLLTVWDAHEGRLLEAKPMEFPRGVTLTLDQKLFVVTFGKNPRLGLFPVPARASDPLVLASETSGGTITGSHVYAWRG